MCVISDRDDPHITEEIMFSHSVYRYIHVNVLEEPLMKHGVLDEASLHVMHGLRDWRRPIMDVMDYVMYRLGKKESGLQIFYHCLREAQYLDPSFREVTVKIERAGNKQKSLTIHNSFHLSQVFLSPQQNGELLFRAQPQRINPTLYVNLYGSL